LLVLLSACGRVDSQATFFHENLRQPSDNQRLPDPEPDAARLIKDNSKRVFTESSRPTNVRLSALRRNPTGPGWNVCIKATITTISKATIPRTYVVAFDRGEIGLRRTATPADGCETEPYTRL
jgi:hypothetical protein